MRKNLPVTDREKKFGSATKLISVTDTKGTILECNDAFVEVSGFETKSDLFEYIFMEYGGENCFNLL